MNKKSLKPKNRIWMPKWINHIKEGHNNRWEDMYLKSQRKITFNMKKRTNKERRIQNIILDNPLRIISKEWKIWPTHRKRNTILRVMSLIWTGPSNNSMTKIEDNKRVHLAGNSISNSNTGLMKDKSQFKDMGINISKEDKEESIVTGDSLYKEGMWVSWSWIQGINKVDLT